MMTRQKEIFIRLNTFGGYYQTIIESHQTDWQNVIGIIRCVDFDTFSKFDTLPIIRDKFYVKNVNTLNYRKLNFENVAIDAMDLYHCPWPKANVRINT